MIHDSWLTTGVGAVLPLSVEGVLLLLEIVGGGEVDGDDAEEATGEVGDAGLSLKPVREPIGDVVGGLGGVVVIR